MYIYVYIYIYTHIIIYIYIYIYNFIYHFANAQDFSVVFLLIRYFFRNCKYIWEIIKLSYCYSRFCGILISSDEASESSPDMRACENLVSSARSR